MEVGEKVAMALTKLVESDPECEEDPDTKDWEAKVNDWGGRTGCSGTALYNNMKGFGNKQPFFGGPDAFVEKPAKGKKWKADDLDETHFPVQAHHVIPKNHLPSHFVCTFLAKKYTKHKLYKLKVDAPYSTDHPNNGYCLPYATPLAEWKKAGRSANVDAEKLNICLAVMAITGRQLHQGSHRAAPYEGPIDDDEEPNIHEAGYLDLVDQLLDVVQGGEEMHAQNCEICNPGLKKKPKVQLLPRQAVVEHMDQVAGIVKLLIDANRTFISEPAAAWGRMSPLDRLKLPVWLKG